MNTQSVECADIVRPAQVFRPAYLMCPPKLYDVAYVINPWMNGNLHASSRALANEQWQHLHNTLSALADIELIDPRVGSPDMVFTANAGLVHAGTAVPSRFFHPERRAEEQYFSRWFHKAGYKVVELPAGMFFEGEGDALFSADGSRLWAGYGPRTSYESHQYLARAWDIEVVPLHLIDPRFYHLDTCFSPLAGNYVMYYPGAFDATSIAHIEAAYPEEKRIVVAERDAFDFACNAINIDRAIIVNGASRELVHSLETAGFCVVKVSLTEFVKAGGAAKCLVMNIESPASLW
ncbi:MAG: amidinotransferase [Acidobacteria bacterium]|nr:amidinotransferase [Acidobacteriota bacterium]